MSGLVSICIPAWERPDLLIAAVKSCLAQTYGEIEVVVSDDSRTDRASRAIEPYLGDARLRYIRNGQRLNQAYNVNRLFDLARGDRLVLLHDDDLLLPDAVSILDQCWRATPALTACYGKHYLTTHRGTVLPGLTRGGSEGCYRVRRHEGLQTEPLWAVLAGQFPPDGFMVLTAAARATRFRGEDEVGHACDFDFRLRLAQQGGRFYFVDRYVSTYRVTDTSVSSDANGVDYAFLLARDLQLPARLEQVRHRFLCFRTPLALRGYLASGQRNAAWELLWQDQYWPGGRMSAMRFHHFLLFLIPRALAHTYRSGRHAMRTQLRRRDALYCCVLRLRSMVAPPAFPKSVDDTGAEQLGSRAVRRG